MNEISFTKMFHESLEKQFNCIGQVIFEQGTTWKQISNHKFFPKDTSLESEKIEGISGGTGCGGQNAPKCSPLVDK